MTITTHDCFAVLPKRCDRCNRLFWLEPYDIYYKEVGIEHYPIRHIKCSKHYGAKMDGGEEVMNDITAQKWINEIIRLKRRIKTLEDTNLKRGRWIYVDAPVFGNPYGSYECSECGNGEPHKTRYCSGCGTLMEEGE